MYLNGEIARGVVDSCSTHVRDTHESWLNMKCSHLFCRRAQIHRYNDHVRSYHIALVLTLMTQYRPYQSIFASIYILLRSFRPSSPTMMVADGTRPAYSSTGELVYKRCEDTENPTPRNSPSEALADSRAQIRLAFQWQLQLHMISYLILCTNYQLKLHSFQEQWFGESTETRAPELSISYMRIYVACDSHGACVLDEPRAVALYNNSSCPHLMSHQWDIFRFEKYPDELVVNYTFTQWIFIQAPRDLARQ